MINQKVFDVRGYNEILNNLAEMVRRPILYNALKVGAYTLRENTRTQLNNTDLNLNYKQREGGVQMKQYDNIQLVRVYLKPQLYMHWFEAGTQDRYNKKTGKYLGKIRPRNYFEIARSNETEIYNSIYKAIDNQIIRYTK